MELSYGLVLSGVQYGPQIDPICALRLVMKGSYSKSREEEMMRTIRMIDNIYYRNQETFVTQQRAVLPSVQFAQSLNLRQPKSSENQMIDFPIWGIPSKATLCGR